MLGNFEKEKFKAQTPRHDGLAKDVLLAVAQMPNSRNDLHPFPQQWSALH